jgi:hypothetical protein
MDYFQPFYLNIFSLISFFFLPCELNFFSLHNYWNMYGELMLILNLNKQMGDGLERLNVNNSRSMGTIGVCLSSFEYTWSLPLTTYIHLLNCKFLMWNVSLNMNS